MKNGNNTFELIPCLLFFVPKLQNVKFRVMELLPEITSKTCLNIVFLCNTYIGLSRQKNNLVRHLSSGYCNRSVGWSYCSDSKRKCLPFFLLWLQLLILVLPLVQPLYKYHLFKMPLFLQVLSFGRAKGEEDPLSL